MRTAFYAGASGLLANQKAMDNVANNVANVSTSGYKPQNISFQSLIFDEMYVNTPTDPEKGNGVKSEINDTNFNPSSVTPTSYDFGAVLKGKQTTKEIAYTTTNISSSISVTISNPECFTVVHNSTTKICFFWFIF